MADTIRPHGSDTLLPLLLQGDARKQELARAEQMPQWTMSSRETGDVIMLGIGGFTPLKGFMNATDWQGVCADMRTESGIFWPIPVTLSVTEEFAKSLKPGAEIALRSADTNEIMATMKVEETYNIDPDHECQHVFKTTDNNHPGVKMVKEQPPVNVAGPLKVLSESYFPTEFAGLYMRPAESRKIFAERGWQTHRRPPAEKPDAPQPRIPGQDRPGGERWPVHPPASRQTEARRHPRRRESEVHRHLGRELLHQGQRPLRRLPPGHALRRPEGRPPPRPLPPKLRLHPHDHRPRPRRRRRLLRPLRRPENLDTRSRPAAWKSRCSPSTGPSGATNAAAWSA